MGAAASHQKFLDAHGPLLEAFVGPQPLVAENFWLELLSFPVPLTQLSPHELESSALPYCEQMVQNNSGTHNFQTLLLYFLRQSQEVNSPERAQQATNTVVFVRIFLKYLTESLNADDLVAFLDAPQRAAAATASAQKSQTDESWVVRLTEAAVRILLDVKVRDWTYLLLLETTHLLLAMISTQLYSPSTTAEPGGHPFTEVLMDSQERAALLLNRLLRHFTERKPLPPKAPVFVPPNTERRGVLRFVRSAAVSVLWLPIQALTFLVRSGNQRLPDSPLSETGLLLLLALLHHAPAENHENPFQRCLQSLQDSGSSTENGDGDAEAPSFSGRADSLSFRDVYEALGKNLTCERSVLLLYDLLHSCPQFRNFAVVQSSPQHVPKAWEGASFRCALLNFNSNTENAEEKLLLAASLESRARFPVSNFFVDLETVLLPLLQMLHAAVGRTASQMYMLLIVILILSQDPTFSTNIHTINLGSVPWYNERLLHNNSLGSLMMVLLLRTAHYNLSKLKDVYLHTNTLAALANLAPQMSNLSSHAAQRLVSLFDMLARRYMRLSQWAAEGRKTDEGSQELQVYFDFLRIVLEILNCIVVRGLNQNPELVYALLHRQDIFEPFQEYKDFQELLENLQLVVGFFNARIDEAREKQSFEWSVANVLRIVKAHLKEWPGGRSLRQFPELRFTYEEEASPEGFFVPYVWTLIVTHTTLPWRPQAIALFSPVSLTGEDAPSLDGIGSDLDLATDERPSAALAPDAADNV